jgi:hypothetical protein
MQPFDFTWQCIGSNAPIEHCDAMTPPQQCAGDVMADELRAAENQNVHASRLLWMSGPDALDSMQQGQ